jgi:hypothetical protein
VAPATAPLVTLPIVLIALLKFSEFGVHLFKARDGSSTWYFRFSPRAVLQVRDDGDWCWRQGTRRWRREIAPFLARAEALLAEGGEDAFQRGLSTHLGSSERPPRGPPPVMGT